MRLEFMEGKRRHRAEVEEQQGGRFKVLWTELDEAGAIIDQQELVLDAREMGEGRYSVLSGHDVHDVGVVRDGDRRIVELADGAVALTWLDPLRPQGAAKRGPAGPVTVASPIPGRVVRIPVAIGDTVTSGQSVVVVEAMKMANELRSPIDGHVTAIRTATGATVDAGAPLVTITPA